MTDVVVNRSGPATLDFVEELHPALAELWESAPGVPEDVRMLFTLAVIEIATNIAVHADADHPVSIDVELGAGEDLYATLHDDAPPVQVDLTSTTMADALAESGRGIAIAAAVCDDLSLERRNGNVWRMRRRLTASA